MDTGAVLLVRTIGWFGQSGKRVRQWHGTDVRRYGWAHSKRRTSGGGTVIANATIRAVNALAPRRAETAAAAGRAMSPFGGHDADPSLMSARRRAGCRLTGCAGTAGRRHRAHGTPPHSTCAVRVRPRERMP